MAMASMVITRLKKSKQSVKVTDVAGSTFEGVISNWDDFFFSVRTENGDDVFFPVQGIANFVIEGGYEKREEREE
jgi:hypothetical protein